MDLNGASTAAILDWQDGATSAPARPTLVAEATPGLRSMRMSAAAAQQIQTDIGFAIRRRRRLVDMTLRALADACGVSFQQIHKYEAGQCSVSAVQLWRIGGALGVPITYFFERVKTHDQA
ncbi:helix-turn-helix domain-containing protein [Phenylobacterium sp.]|uniref:helix-turn-helix domain-containing protein n=1 Tax=Phenylobacterium sp. TaxID=1871053 RepID=UPI003562F909